MRVILKCPVQISAGSLSIMTENFFGYPQSIQGNFAVVYQIRRGPLLNTLFTIHVY
jgi:hypothetical protein